VAIGGNVARGFQPSENAPRRIESKLPNSGPVREQPTRVLSEVHSSRMTPPRPSGRPFAATRWAFDSLSAPTAKPTEKQGPYVR